MQVLIVTAFLLEYGLNAALLVQTENNYNRIEFGMTVPQVQQILGGGHRASFNRSRFTAWWEFGENIDITVEFDIERRVVRKEMRVFDGKKVNTVRQERNGFS